MRSARRLCVICVSREMQRAKPINADEENLYRSQCTAMRCYRAGLETVHMDHVSTPLASLEGNQKFHGW